MARRTAKKAHEDTSQVYQLKVTLKRSSPPIWRRVQIRGSYTLFDLHVIIQIVMGWSNSHLHQFELGGIHFGEPDLESPFAGWGPEVIEEDSVRLEDLVPIMGKRLKYEYDFGDGWEHLIEVEKILPVDPEVYYPVCLKGRRACPPEDVGGIWGYAEFLEAINDPAHPAHEEWLEWIGGEFDPLAFDLDEINSRLRRADDEVKFGRRDA